MRTGLNVIQPVASSSLLRGSNLVWDAAFRALGGTGGWSTRIGYEPYFPDTSTGWAPFSALGPIDSLYVWAYAPARYFILFESGGTLYLLHEFGGNTPSILALATNRYRPTYLSPVTKYTPVADGVLVTNGQDTPLLVQPWPLASIAIAPGTVAQVVRPFGMVTAPPAAPLDVTPIDATSGSAASTDTFTTGDSVCIWWPTTGTALGYPNQAGIGYGTTGGDSETNAYTYRISFVSDLGGEGPLSDETVLSWESPANQTLKAKHVPALRIPTGPAGTVARKLWRSQNWADGSPTEGDDSLYLSLIVPNNVDDLVFDATMTAALGASAPATGSRVELPIKTPQFAAFSSGRLFIAGSPNDPYTVFFSRTESPEWFSAGDYLNLNSIGGAITGLVAHYGVTLVLRERCLDMIDQDLRASTLLGGVECLAPHSAVQTPYGVVFAARDGLYLVEGGTIGGASVSVRKLSDAPSISEVWSRAVAPSGPLLSRAVAVWDPIRAEYWLQVPSNGADRLDLGIVWHPQAPEGQSFSLRRGFPVGCFGTMPNGEVIFGHHTGAVGQSQDPAGLFVVSGRRSMGIKYQADTYVWNEPPTSLYRSIYMDFGDAAALKTITYVTLYVVTTGDVNLTLQTAINGGGPWVDARPLKMQPPNGPVLPVWAKSATDYDGATLPFTQLLSDEYNSALGQVVPVRFSVGERRCNSFAFQFVTTDDVVLVGFSVEGNVPADGMRGPGGQR